MTIPIASHAKGRGFNPLTAHTSQTERIIAHDESAFALIHGHLISIASLCGQSGAFLCSELNPLDRALATPSSESFLPDQHACLDGTNFGGDL